MEWDLEPVEPPQPPAPDDDRQWPVSFALLLLLFAVAVAFHLLSAASGRRTADNARQAALLSGDMAFRADQAWPNGRFTAAATRDYQRALPWPSAYRRLGVLRQSYGASGLPQFSMMDSLAASRTLTNKEVAKLRREKAMWLHIYASENLTQDEARRYAKDIESLNLGPLKALALGNVYWRSGQRAKYYRLEREAKASARVSLVGAGALLTLLAVGGVAGFVLAIAFLLTSAGQLAVAPHARLQSSILLSAFTLYLVAYYVLGASVELVTSGKSTGAAYMASIIVAALAACAIGLLFLSSSLRRIGQDWREIGWRTASAGRDILWGIAGYLSALLPVFVAGVISMVLSRTVFRHFPTPQQPFDEILSRGGVLTALLVFIGASVVAPIVEETFFRGVMYTAFRGKWGVVPSVLLTSTLFASIHPLPGAFLPIFTLACVLAVLREKSGSLLPGIICHGIYNTVSLLLAKLLLG